MLKLLHQPVDQEPHICSVQKDRSKESKEKTPMGQ